MYMIYNINHIYYLLNEFKSKFLFIIMIRKGIYYGKKRDTL